MQLYKSRGFSAFFQDTFAFLKLNGKHFFKYYFAINGVFLLLMLILSYFFTRFYTDVVFGSLSQTNPNEAVDIYMNENFGLFMIFFLLFIIVGIISGIVSYAYTPFYMRLYIERSGKSFKTKDLITLYKNNIGKLLIYVLCSILLLIPVVAVFSVILFALAISVVGLIILMALSIFIMPLVIEMLSLFFTMALMEYLDGKRGIWESFGYSWTLMQSKFWPAVGSVSLFFLMNYILQNMVTLIVYIFGFIKTLTSLETNSPDPQELSASMTVIMLVTFFVGFILSAFLNNIMLINQGMVYYGLKEDNENINTSSIIDQIGSGE